MPIDDLIARLEQAANGSPALDAEVAALIASGADNAATPPYTSSVEAALTLIDEHFEIGLQREGGCWSAWCEPPKWFSRLRHYPAKQPALALCIAALEARRRQTS
jgi:hypothetical protein